MPSIKQEKMDISSSDESSDNRESGNKVRLKEFQLLNTSAPTESYVQGKVSAHKQLECRNVFQISL